MAKITRAQLVTLLNSKVLTGGRRTTAQNVRDFENAIIESLINILDDKDTNDGYLGIDSDGRVNISFINSATPSNYFLRDDGTWAPGGGGSQTLQQTTALGNTTTDGIIFSSEIPSTIVSLDPSKKIKSLDTSTYPSLTELSYVKGVTSAIQTQLNAKQGTLVSGTNIKTVNGTTLLGSGNLQVGTILGSVSATAGLIPFGTGTLDTVTTNSNFGFAVATNVLFVNNGQIRAGNNTSGYAGTILASNLSGHNIAALNALTTDSASLNFPSAVDSVIYWGEIRKYGFGASGTFGSTGLALGSSLLVKAGTAAANTVFAQGGRFTYAVAAGTTFYGFTMPYTGGMRIGTEPFIGGASLANIALHLDNGDATATHLKFTNGTTTGTTVNDGSDIGITSTGVLEIRQRENLEMNFYTNNTLRYSISKTGTHTLGVVTINSSGTIDNVSAILAGTLVLNTHFRPAYTNDASSGSDVTLSFQNAPVKVLTNAALASVAGIPASYAYATFWGENATGVDIVFKHQNAAATSTNRIITPTGADFTVKAGAMFGWTYSTTQNRNILWGVY